MWSAVSAAPDVPAPSSRAKHSATLLGGYIYLLGGRNGNVPLKDLWRYNLGEGRWEQLQPIGEKPPCLQEHSAVAYRDCIYVFGGEVGFSAGSETPLWIYNVKNNSWRKVHTQKGVTVPRGRRGHTALVHRGTMLIYGGYQDLRGSTNELWGFHFETESWHLLSSAGSRVRGGVGSGSGNELPPARHKHSALIHDDAMWVYGGMTDLQERSDLWKWDTVSKVWTNIKSKSGPGFLHSHAACKLPSSMLIFGGERDGQSSNELWRFHFGTETWEKIQVPGPRPNPRAESVALAVSELLLRGSSLMSLSSHLREHRSRASSSADRSNHNVRHPSCHVHNRVSPCEKKLAFVSTTGSYIDNTFVDQNVRRRVQNSGNTLQVNGGGFLREITKLSQINLSRISHHTCSYSVLTSSSRDDSTESLLLQHSSSTVDRGKDGTDQDEHGTPNKMIKSQSANILSRRNQLSSTISPCSAIPPASVMVQQNESYIKNMDRTIGKENQHNTNNNKHVSLTRNPVSVPNFGTIGSNLPTPALTPVEMTKLVYLDTDEESENEVFGKENEQNNIIHVKPSPQGSTQTGFASIHQQFQPGTHLNSKARRSDSYNSHLLAAMENGNHSSSYFSSQRTNGIPKSASVKLRNVHEVSDVEETSDETFSTSDYASIASMSNYSMCNKASPMDPHFQSDHHTDECNSGVFSRTCSSRQKLSGRDGPFGFCNPNYLGPDIQTILASAGQRNSWHASSEQEHAVHRQSQSFAKLLNSPPDSVLEDSSGRSISGQFCREEFMELQNIDSPSPVTTPGIQMPSRTPPHFLALYGQQPELDRKKKSRASSASRVEKQYSQPLDNNEDSSCFSTDTPVPLYMFVFGGKEQGQVTVFKRPMSVWRLLLAPNIY